MEIPKNPKLPISKSVDRIRFPKEAYHMSLIMKKNGYKILVFCRTKHGIVHSSKELSPGALMVADTAATTHVQLNGCTVENVNTGASYIGHG